MHHAAGRFIEIARIGKAHGLEGVVRVQPEIDSAENLLNENQVLYLQNRRGDLIPARIESVRVESKRKMQLFFVKFDRITDRTQAESFQDVPVYSDRSEVTIQAEEKDDWDPRDVIGFEVEDSSGIEAVVTEVLENPAHLIIKMNMKSGLKSILVPWVDAYVLSVDYKNRLMKCQNLDLFLEL